MFGLDDALAIGAIGSAVAGGIGSFFGGRSESRGQEKANQMNLDIAREQMAFQERMANTSWQRGVADMRAAGINPMLAVSKGGAVAPTGSTATMQNPNIGIARGITQGLNSASSALSSVYALKTASANAREAGARADVAEAGVPKAQVQAEPWIVARNAVNMARQKVEGIFGNKTKNIVYEDPGELAVRNTSHPSRMPPIARTNVADLPGKLRKQYEDAIWSNASQMLMNKFGSMLVRLISKS